MDMTNLSIPKIHFLNSRICRQRLPRSIKIQIYGIFHLFNLFHLFVYCYSNLFSDTWCLDNGYLSYQLLYLNITKNNFTLNFQAHPYITFCCLYSFAQLIRIVPSKIVENVLLTITHFFL